MLFDLKIGELKHQDIGQMQMYVNYYDRKVKLEDENPTIGIVLCKDKNNAVVEMTLPENNTQIFASKYQTERAGNGFHTKGYIFQKSEECHFIIGSSNLTQDALTRKTQRREAVPKRFI